MNRILFYVSAIIIAMCFTACSTDSEQTVIETKQDKSYIGDIKVESEFIGRGQKIILRCPQTVRADEDVVWKVDGENIGSTNTKKDSVVWSASLGEHTITATLANLTKTKIVKVIECDLGKGIIGDNISKIIRTLGLQDSYNLLSSKIQDGNIIYNFDNGHLSSIKSTMHKSVSSQNKVDLMLPIIMFNQYYGPFTKRFGEPTYKNFSSDFANMDENDKANEGLKVLYGQIWYGCDFQTQSGHTLSLEMTGRNGYSFSITMLAR